MEGKCRYLPGRARSMGPSTVEESGFSWGTAQVRPGLVSAAVQLKHLMCYLIACCTDAKHQRFLLQQHQERLQVK